MNGVHMNVAATTTAMDRFTQAGTTFASEWSGTADSIGEAAGELGRGPLGTAFMGMYSAVAGATARQTTEAAQVPERLGAAGLACVGDYQRADDASRQALPGPR